MRQKSRLANFRKPVSRRSQRKGGAEESFEFKIPAIFNAKGVGHDFARHAVLMAWSVVAIIFGFPMTLLLIEIF
jgi:hypothetical protein